MRVHAVGDLALYAVEGSSADEEDIFGVDRYHLLIRMLAPSIRRHEHSRAFQKLKQSLLHTLAADIAGDRGVVALTGNLVDLIDKDYTLFGTLHVIVAILEQSCQKRLDILAYISGLCEDRGVDYCEGNIEKTSYTLGKQCLSGSGRTDHDDVGFLDLHLLLIRLRYGILKRCLRSLLVACGLLRHSFVMIIDGHRKVLLRLILTDHILVKIIPYLVRSGDLIKLVNRHRLCSF